MLIMITAALAIMAVGCAEEPVEEVMAGEPEEIQPENRLEAILQSGELKIGISADYAPFMFLDETASGAEKYVGSDIELGRYIAGQMGVEAVFCDMEFDDCLNAVRDGEVDMVLLGMLPKPERRSKMAFTDAYYKPGKQVLVVKKSEEELTKGEEASKEEKRPQKEQSRGQETESAEEEELLLADELAGWTVAAQYGTLQAQLVAEQLPESYMKLTDTAEEGIAMVDSGLVDAVALDNTGIVDVMRKYPNLKVYSTGFEYTPEEIVGGVVRSEPELLEKVNDILEDVTSQKLYLEWMDEANQLAARQNEKRIPAPAKSPQSSQPVSPVTGSVE